MCMTVTYLELRCPGGTKNFILCTMWKWAKKKKIIHIFLPIYNLPTKFRNIKKKKTSSNIIQTKLIEIFCPPKTWISP